MSFWPPAPRTVVCVHVRIFPSKIGGLARHRGRFELGKAHRRARQVYWWAGCRCFGGCAPLRLNIGALPNQAKWCRPEVGSFLLSRGYWPIYIQWAQPHPKSASAPRKGTSQEYKWSVFGFGLVQVRVQVRVQVGIRVKVFVLGFGLRSRCVLELKG